jgi:isoleucyl-tRNA synthetase
LLKQIHNKKLIVKGHKVLPYCPRCGTGLSSHEVAQGYKTVIDPSIFVKVELKDTKESLGIEKAFMLV